MRARAEKVCIRWNKDDKNAVLHSGSFYMGPRKRQALCKGPSRPCLRPALSVDYKYNNENDYFIRCNFIYNTQFNIKLTDMHWLNWIYSLADNFDLSLGLVNVFDIFVTESETVFYCYIWKMDLALLHCYSRDREFFANLAFFAAHGPRFFRFLAAKKLHH